MIPFGALDEARDQATRFGITDESQEVVASSWCWRGELQIGPLCAPFRQSAIGSFQNGQRRSSQDFAPA
jgi:hypothetical protein